MGYYNAAVLDGDGNSVEVVCRDVVEMAANASGVRGEGSRVLGWQEDVARSFSDGRSVVGNYGGGGGGGGGGRTVVVSRTITPTVVVSSPAPDPAQATGDMSAKAIIGTLLGAAAGAAVAYAMTTAEAASQAQAQAQPAATAAQTIYRAIEGARTERPYQAGVESRAPTTILQEIDYANDPPPPARSTTSSARRPRSALRAIEAPPLPSAPSSRSTLINTFIPPSEVPLLLPPQRPSPVTAKSETSLSTRSAAKSHRSSSKPPTVIRASSAVARDMPLPRSSRTSAVSAAHDGPDVARSLVGSVLGLDLGGSVAPSDSVSQAGSKRSHKSKTSKSGSRDSSRPPMHGRHDSNRSSSSRVEKDEVIRPDESVSQVSGGSQRTVRPSKTEGRSTRGSVMSLPQGRAGSKVSGVRERSVVSMVRGK